MCLCWLRGLCYEQGYSIHSGYIFLSCQYTRHFRSSYQWIYWLPEAETHLRKCLSCLSHMLHSRTCSKFKPSKLLRFPFSCFCQWSTRRGSVRINSYQELIFWISFFITSPWFLGMCCPVTSLFCHIQECISPCLTYSQKWKFLFITWWKLKDTNLQCVLHVILSFHVILFNINNA